MNYTLNIDKTKKVSTWAGLKSLWPLLRNERKNLVLSFLAIMINSLMNLAGPFLIGHTVDTYVLTGNYRGVLVFSGILLGLFAIGLVAGYLQTKWMGSVSQRMLFSLRATVFNKLQELPVAFFNQNKAGDLISRINNDTDKLNQFFSQALMQFIGSVFMMLGAGIFVLSLNIKLGVASLLPAVAVLVLTRALSPWIKRKNAENLQSTGGLSAEIQESLNNFKVIVAFNRRDYFRKRFAESATKNYTSAVGAGIANNFFTPIYAFFSTVAQLIVITFGIYLILHGQFTLGLLISFLSYTNNFYSPLRQLAALWSSFQTALAGWDRITAILNMKNDVVTLPEANETTEGGGVLAFRNVSFAYPEGKQVLRNVSFSLEAGKTYALVGPTGGGKTTTASLMARMFDPTEGKVFLNGKDIRSYNEQNRTQKIGFILQEPFLFSGTVRENIAYGNAEYSTLSAEEFAMRMQELGFAKLLSGLEKDFETEINAGGETMSLGQRQIIAFIRAVLRKPDVLILDEATANIDTVTEQMLEDVLQKLPASTTRVIIAHRLNTIANADEIFFVNEGNIAAAGSLEQAVDMLLHGKRTS